MKPGTDWTDQARDLLETSARDLDAATLSRLNRARQHALAAAAPRAAWRWPRRLAVAASLLLAVAVWWPSSMPPSSTASATLSAEDAELLADGELEMTDDLEFYAWLDADDEHNG